MPATTDPTFYRSPAVMAAPPERLAYVAALDPAGTPKAAALLGTEEQARHRPGDATFRLVAAAAMRVWLLLQAPAG